jgi:hypothetical protein
VLLIHHPRTVATKKTHPGLGGQRIKDALELNNVDK